MFVFHAIDPADDMFCHNIQLSKGRIIAVSYARSTDRNLSGMVSPYEAFTAERDKEDVFESIRRAEFSACPSRLGSIFLFATKAAADRANERWWNNKRVILPASITLATRKGEFDGAHLNAVKAEWEPAARKYWSGAQSNDPWPEVLVEGVVQVQGWEAYGRLFGKPRA
jgi:hypothetical protein